MGVSYAELEELLQTFSTIWNDSMQSQQSEINLAAQSLNHMWDVRGKVELQVINSIQKNLVVNFRNTSENQKEFLKKAKKLFLYAM